MRVAWGLDLDRDTDEILFSKPCKITEPFLARKKEYTGEGREELTPGYGP